ncbi:MAG: ParB/RepB/Spo0J family partition protein [Thermodesulfobacteriota bacterium]|nr:ParB/RepB/Spo0J family partition protein [Thermodesulfobacteriota bacterium]
MSGSPLGKGLGALLPDSLQDVEEGAQSEEKVLENYFFCPVVNIEPNPYQPRREIDESGLAELAESIRAKGVLQPLVVRKKEAGGYQLIAGERRLRASRIAGLDKVPVIVREAEKEDRLELALIENVQRQNLNPIEEATAYQRLTREFSLTQEEIARKVGKERSTVANSMRLLQLPEFAREDIINGILSVGHGRVLLSLGDEQAMKEVRNIIVNQSLSVRQSEQLVKKKKRHNVPSRTATIRTPIPSSYCRTLTKDFVSSLGTKSRIVQNGDKGRIEIEYYSLDDLERLHKMIVRNGEKS